MDDKNNKKEIGFETQIIYKNEDADIDVKDVLSKVYYA